MAVSLGKLKMAGEKQKASRQIAKEYEAQQRKESKRKGWSSFLGGIGGKLLGAGIGGALGIASGGLLMPLIMGASSTMSKKWIDEASKNLGYGADVSKIKGGKYGFGKEEAKTLREGLEEQMETEDWKKNIGKDIALSYVSAGVSGKLGGVKGALKGGGKEQLWMGGKGDVIGTGKGLYAGESIGEGFLGGIGEKIGLGSTFGGKDDVIDEEEYLKVGDFAQGGLVSQNTTPTIADYFGRQGVSLGGSNKQSLSQMLGR